MGFNSFKSTEQQRLLKVFRFGARDDSLATECRKTISTLQRIRKA